MINLDTPNHIVQNVIGNIAVSSNANLSKEQKKQGYCAVLCTVDENGRFIDVVLKKDQLGALKMLLNYLSEIKSL